MKLRCQQSKLRGNVEIPGSKSHTIRAVTIASLADGQSVIEAPLKSADTLAALQTYKALGVCIECEADCWRIMGSGGRFTPPSDVITVGNSGTTLRLAVGSAALLGEGQAIFTGDAQIRRRPIGPLAASLNDLGAYVTSTRGNGCAPLIVAGRLRGGKTTIEAVTSQYLSSLLINCPLAQRECEIEVPVLNEKPYVHITLDWLERGKIQLDREGLKKFHIPGNQRYQPMHVRVPGDFSSATFFLAAGALHDNDVVVKGLDMRDPQGDKAVVEYLRQMGARISISDEGIHIHPGTLTGCEIDMNDTPDALPMMAALACFAEGKTSLVNVPQARLKETDRIAVMCQELSKMGARIQERPDGLEIEQSDLQAARVCGHDDHRVVMALAVAATAVKGVTEIETAEAMNITFPDFVTKMSALGASLELFDDDA
jgi:3-phosphoshikimate 1-carboxyvinyltransferase